MPEREATGKGLNRTSVRLSLKFAFLYAILSAAMFFGAYWFTDYEVRDWIKSQMNSDANVLERVYETRGIDALKDRVSALSEVSFKNERIYLLRGRDGTDLAGNIIDMEPIGALDYMPVSAIVTDQSPDPEILGYWVSTRDFGPYTLMLGTGDHVVSEVVEALSIALLVGYVVVISAGLVIGLAVGVHTERRIGQITTTLGHVSHGALAQRIPFSEGDTDDLSRVSGSINAMLDQLETLFESQKQISNDIAHDLRTPLQRLRQRLERQIANGSKDDDLHAALGETENLIQTFNALLRIAQLETGVRHKHFERLDLSKTLQNVADIYQAVAEDEGQSLSCSIPEHSVEIDGDPTLLQQLLSNLIENAIRHCPAGATFSLALERRPDDVRLTVMDDGPGIPAGETGKVFRRFYRVDKSRASGGHGLGLPLVKAICRVHAATIKLADAKPGLRVSIIFPNPAPG